MLRYSVVSDSLWPHGLWPTRLLCLSNFPSKNTRKSESGPVMCDSLQPQGLYSPWNFPGQKTGVESHYLLQGTSQPRDQTQVSCIVGRLFSSWATREAQEILVWGAYPFSSGSSLPRNQTRVSCIAGSWATCSITGTRKEYWSGVPFPIPGDLLNLWVESMSVVFPALAGIFFICYCTTWESSLSSC